MHINNVSDLLQYFESENYSTRLDLLRDEILVFRGQGNSNYDLIPGIGREPNGCICNQLTLFEKSMYESAKNEFPEIFLDELKPIDILAKLQHYGIPTRLLDVTENPLVALYFACSTDYGNDGEFFAFKIKNNRPTYDGISNAIADTSSISMTEFKDFLNVALSKKYFDDERTAINSILLSNPDYATSWIKECCNTLLYIKGPYHTRRQQIQQGRFLLFHNSFYEIKGDDDKEKCYFRDKIDPIDKEDEDIVVAKLTIPAERKKIILEQLDRIGINRKNLFADSVDIVCEEIKKHYMLRYKNE